MKTQPLGKRLLIPLLLIEIATIGVKLSSPAQSASLKDSQSILIAQTEPSDSPTEPESPPPSPESSCDWLSDWLGLC